MKIVNIEARNEIQHKIMSARISKRYEYGSAIAFPGIEWLAKGERAVGIVGGFANMAIFSPKGARNGGDVDKVMFYGREATLVHEEDASEEIMRWFNAAYDRAS